MRLLYGYCSISLFELIAIHETYSDYSYEIFPVIIIRKSSQIRLNLHGYECMTTAFGTAKVMLYIVPEQSTIRPDIDEWCHRRFLSEDDILYKCWTTPVLDDC